MQVITAIYLNCRPDLRDEWLTGIEVDDAVDAQVRGQRDATHIILRLTNVGLTGAGGSFSSFSQVL